jgi:hypothetical protein
MLGRERWAGPVFEECRTRIRTRDTGSSVPFTTDVLARGQVCIRRARMSRFGHGIAGLQVDQAAVRFI